MHIQAPCIVEVKLHKRGATKALEISRSILSFFTLLRLLPSSRLVCLHFQAIKVDNRFPILSRGKERYFETVIIDFQLNWCIFEDEKISK